jgi:uncharacterized protein YbaP (TraB family)
MRPKILLVAFLAVLLGCSHIATAAKPISFWVLESEQAKVYLLGSIHVMRPDMYPLPAPVEAAFLESDLTVFEVDMRDSTGIVADRLMQQKGFFAGHETIYTQLAEETLVLLKAYFQSNNIDIGQFEQVRPWMLSVNVGLIELRKLGFDSAKGIDLHYQQKARKAGKPVLALETFEEQIELLSGDSPRVQELGLKLALQYRDEAPEFIDVLIKAWAKGDAEAMYDASASDYERHPDLAEQFERLLDQRNEKMAVQIGRFLADTDKTYFVVVGALHMGGEKGLLKLLGESYDIRQIMYSAE